MQSGDVMNTGLKQHGAAISYSSVFKGSLVSSDSVRIPAQVRMLIMANDLAPGVD